MTLSIPSAHVGHVPVKVADLDRSITFYRDILGFDFTARLDVAALLAEAS